MHHFNYLNYLKFRSISWGDTQIRQIRNKVQASYDHKKHPLIFQPRLQDPVRSTDVTQQCSMTKITRCYFIPRFPQLGTYYEWSHGGHLRWTNWDVYQTFSYTYIIHAIMYINIQSTQQKRTCLQQCYEYYWSHLPRVHISLVKPHRNLKQMPALHLFKQFEDHWTKTSAPFLQTHFFAKDSQNSPSNSTSVLSISMLSTARYAFPMTLPIWAQASHHDETSVCSRDPGIMRTCPARETTLYNWVSPIPTT